MDGGRGGRTRGRGLVNNTRGFEKAAWPTHTTTNKEGRAGAGGKVIGPWGQSCAG